MPQHTPDDTLLKLISAIAINPATADSIFGALGLPEQPLQGANLGSTKGGFFDPPSRGITLNTGMFPFETPGILAHELGHQFQSARGAQAFGIENVTQPSPDLQAVLDDALEVFKEAPPEAQVRLFEDYFGEGVLEESASKAGGTVQDQLDILTRRGLGDFRTREVIANTLQRGFELARITDPSDPDVGKEERNKKFDEFPGTREFFNFFLRSFQPASPLLTKEAQ